MAIIHNLNARRPQPSLDEVIDDEFVARRAMREGQFDDGLTIPFDSLYPFPRPRAPTPSPKQDARRGLRCHSIRRSPRTFIDHTETVKDCIAVIAIILVLLVTLAILP